MIEEIANTSVAEVAQREVARSRPSETVGTALGRMVETTRGNILVEDDDGKLVGIFTERDLLERLSHDEDDWRERTLGEVMTSEPVTVLGTSSIAEAMRKMGAGGFRHLPVVDANGRAEGVISIRDLLSHVIDFFPQEFINLPPDPDHEAKEPWGG